MRPQSEFIREFIIGNVDTHPRDIAKLTSERFAISRQAVNRHLRTLIEDGIVQAEGKTKERTYSLVVITEKFLLEIADNREEDRVWLDRVGPLLKDYRENIKNICYYGFTEMYNNVVDHSGGTSVLVRIDRSAKSISLILKDNGVGVFEKIKSRFGLADHREAILELSKGKLTTDPAHHSGQGIFFTSRMFDKFSLASSHLFFSHDLEGDDWLIETNNVLESGTAVRLIIAANSHRTLVEVFDRYSHRDENDEFPFSKTHVPLSLARYGNEQLVSRSQAKRVLARFDKFEEVLLNFQGIEMIGQAFADEIFRVFRRTHPNVELIHIHANADVLRMIRRAESPANEPSGPDSP